jgi:hypothetical protein
MPGSKSEIAERGRMIMMLAKKYRMKHPDTKWTECVKEGAKIYRSMKK